jgi:hypothetical protein
MAVGIVSTVSSPRMRFAGVERASTSRSILDGHQEGRPLSIYNERDGEVTPNGALVPSGSLVDRWFWVSAAPAREPRLQ